MQWSHLLLLLLLIGLVVPPVFGSGDTSDLPPGTSPPQDASSIEAGEEIVPDGPYTTNPYLVYGLMKDLKRIELEERGLSGEALEAEIDAAITPPDPYYNHPPMPSKGTVKIAIFMVDFSDMAAPSGYTPGNIVTSCLYNGNLSHAPYESLRNYYRRSSYNQFDMTGMVYSWVRAQHTAAYYNSIKGYDELMMEILTYWDTTGEVDFTQFDSNSDGYLDGIYLIYPTMGGGIYDQPCRVRFNMTVNPSFQVDGKKVPYYIWSNYDTYDGTNEFDPHILIHETGHLLGLDDYYDLYSWIGPPGGTGGWDMMDYNWGDHNCFSKYLLGWITPSVVASGSQKINLRPSGTYGDAVLVMPGYSLSSPYKEFFMVQYREPGVGNDPLLTYGSANYVAKQWPKSLFIWHVDATLKSGTNGYDFAYNNQDTTHKLLRLMEADGLEQIETLSRFQSHWDINDLYEPGQKITPATTPGTKGYSGTPTNIYINQLLHYPGQTPPYMTVRCSVGNTGLLEAEFSHWESDPAFNPFLIDFTDSSSGPPDQWHWYFGDGTQSFLRHPEHMYSATGTYNITLVVTKGSDTDGLIKPITITKEPKAPVASFTYVIPDANAPFTAHLYDTSLGYTDNYAWYLVSGALMKKLSSEKNPVYTFADYGTYPIKFVVSSPWGSSYCFGDVKVVKQIPPEIIRKMNEDLIPKPKADTKKAAIHQPIWFRAAISGGVPTWYYWDFTADGRTDSNDASTSWNFATPGKKKITLVVEDAAGFSDPVTMTVTIKKPKRPMAKLGIDRKKAPAGSPLWFTDLSRYYVSTVYDLDFGDGSPHQTGTAGPGSPMPAQEHRYTVKGKYKPRLTLTDEVGQTKSVKKSITIL